MPIDLELADTCVADDPVPLADAVNALLAAENPHEQRDRMIEVFRTLVRLLAALALAARHRCGPGPGEPHPQAAELLLSLQRRGLTDGQWIGLTRSLLQPWAQAAELHPLPALVRLFHGRRSVFQRQLDALLVMRKSETIAHGGTGAVEEVQAVIERRIGDLEELLRAVRPVFAGARWVVPLAPADGQQAAWRLRGLTPGRGRWRRITLPEGVELEQGHVVVLDDDGRPLLDLHPVVSFRRPSPEAVEELFVLDRGRRGGGAVFVALPSLAEHVDDAVWELLASSLLDRERPEGARSREAERPYRGLASFGVDDAGLFFGRSAESEALANRIRAHALVTVTGPSGSGKSSLVRAGVVPRLTGFSHALLLPGATPLQALSRIGERERPVVYLVDQAEELLTLAPKDQAEAFVTELLARTGEGDRVVFVVREDYFARMATLEPLRGRYTAQVEVLTTPGDDALHAILVEPLSSFGVRFEDEALVQEMVAAVRDEPTALALLQFCADRMWDLRDQQFRTMTRVAYQQLGGVEGALAQHAEQTLARMTPAQQHGARSILLRLVTPVGTRALASREALLEAHPEHAEVLDSLIAARLLTVREGPDGSALVELVHEALLEHWRTFAAWREHDREGQRLAGELRESTAAWESRARSSDLLWRGEVLAAAVRWRATEPSLTSSEAAFLDASEKREQRGRVRTRRLAMGAAAFLIWTVVVMAGLWGVAKRHQLEAEHRSLQLVRDSALAHGDESAGLALHRAHLRTTGSHLLQAEDLLLEHLAVGLAAHFVLPAPGATAVRLPNSDRLAVQTREGVSWFEATTGERLEEQAPLPAPLASSWTVGSHQGRLTLQRGPDERVLPDLSPCEPGPSASNGDWVAVGCGGTLQLWDTRAWDVREVEQRVVDLAFDPQGRVLAAVVGDEVHLWQLDRLQRSIPFAALRDGAYQVALGPDLAVAGGLDGQVIATGLDGSPRWSTPPEPLPVQALRVDGDQVGVLRAGRGWPSGWLAPLERGDPRHTTYTRHGPTGERVEQWSEEGLGTGAALEAQRVLIGQGSTLRTHDGSWRVELPIPVDRLWAPGGRGVIAAAGWRGGPAVSIGRDPLVHALRGASDLTAVGFSPNGGNLIAGDREGTVGLWSASGYPRLEHPGRGVPVVGVAVWDDGGLVAADAGGRLWSTNSDGDTLQDVDLGSPVTAFTTFFGSERVGGAPVPATAPLGQQQVVVGTARGAVRYGDALGEHGLVGLPRAGGPVLALAAHETAVVIGSAVAVGSARIWKTGTRTRSELFEALGARTNLRLCRRDLRQVWVVPFPPPDSIWATPSRCGEEE